MSKEEQKELLAVLPQGVEIINKLTKSQKLVLAQIVLMYGMDYAADNDYVFVTNQKLMEETEIKSEKTIITSVRRRVSTYINRRRRNRYNAIKSNQYR